MSTTFENRLIFLLLVIIAILIISLWSAYNAYMEMQKKIDRTSRKIDAATDYAMGIIKENQKELPSVQEILSYLKKVIDGK